jgi:hypothetical protein
MSDQHRNQEEFELEQVQHDLNTLSISDGNREPEQAATLGAFDGTYSAMFIPSEQMLKKGGRRRVIDRSGPYELALKTIEDAVAERSECYYLC